MTPTLQLHLAGVKVRFTCAFPPLMEYARAHFAPAVAGDEPTPPAAVDAELHWHEGHPPSDPTEAYPEVRGAERLDRDLYARDGHLVWLRIDELRDLHLRFQWDGERLRVRGDFYHRLSTDRRGDQLRRLVYRRQLGALRRKRFTRLLYFTVTYPALWWLERMRDTHPIHAAAVETSRGGLLLAGPSGVGKSTLTTALGAGAGARILSDTFIAHRGVELWAVPEPILLDRWSLQWLGDAGASLAGLEHRYALGRNGYAIPALRYCESSHAAAILLPHRARTPYLRRLDAATAAARIDAYDDIVNDLRRYRPLAAVLELLDPVGLGAARQRNLEQLTRGAPCYEVGLTSALTRAEAVTQLMAVLDGSDQDRAASGARRH